MAKRMVAQTRIILGTGEEEDYVVEENKEVDASKFTKDQLRSLYDAGAILVEEVPEIKHPVNDETEKVEEKPPTKSTPAKATPGSSS